jgi:hypothetical protein
MVAIWFRTKLGRLTLLHGLQKIMSPQVAPTSSFLTLPWSFSSSLTMELLIHPLLHEKFQRHFQKILMSKIRLTSKDSRTAPSFATILTKPYAQELLWFQQILLQESILSSGNGLLILSLTSTPLAGKQELKQMIQLAQRARLPRPQLLRALLPQPLLQFRLQLQAPGTLE